MARSVHLERRDDAMSVVGAVASLLGPALAKLPAPPLSCTDLTVRVSDLPTGLDGLVVAHISDLHVGPGYWGPQRVQEAAQRIREREPDLIVNTGDYLVEEPSLDSVADVVRHFEGIAPQVAVPGNHDYIVGEDTINGLRRVLRGHDIEVVENVGTCVSVAGGRISVFGLTAAMPGFDDAIRALSVADRPRIVLVHEPEIAERIPQGAAELVLAGHTHGGQIAIAPFTPVIVQLLCGSHYVEGMYQVNGNPLFVNRGLGCVGLPLRYRAAPDVTFIRLLRSAHPSG